MLLRDKIWCLLWTLISWHPARLWLELFASTGYHICPRTFFFGRRRSFTSRKLYSINYAMQLSDRAYVSGTPCIVCWLCCVLYMPLKKAAWHYCYFHKQSKVSLGKYMSDHLTFDWRVYFSRPIRFTRTLVCGPFKNLWFSCRRYFKVPLPILLVALSLACQNFISRNTAIVIPPATHGAAWWNKLQGLLTYSYPKWRMIIAVNFSI